MDRAALKRALPTLMTFLERRERAAKNQLPKHLRPLPGWPIFLQMFLNLTLIVLLCGLMINRDEFMSEAVPALGLVVSVLLMISSLIKALQLKQRYLKTPLYRLVKVNLWLTGIAAFLFPVSVWFFLP